MARPRVRRLLAGLCTLLTAAGAVLSAPTAQADAAAPHYYVALGDSLSRGYMPGPGDTDQGYADDLFATLHAKDPSLQLVKLGCSGETTASMIGGGVCTDRYPTGTSQLTAAGKFLTTHRGAVSYLTLDIGANDVAACAESGSIDTACVAKGVASIRQNLTTILQRLSTASGRLPRSVGMSYYDPFLADYLGDTTGKLTAVASVGLLVGIDTLESGLYRRYGFGVADVAGAYRTLDFLGTQNVPGYGTLPTNVATICTLTYMCSQRNIHPTVQGYRVIAAAFATQTG